MSMDNVLLTDEKGYSNLLKIMTDDLIEETFVRGLLDSVAQTHLEYLVESVGLMGQDSIYENVSGIFRGIREGIIDSNKDWSIRNGLEETPYESYILNNLVHDSSPSVAVYLIPRFYPDKETLMQIYQAIPVLYPDKILAAMSVDNVFCGSEMDDYIL